MKNYSTEKQRNEIKEFIQDELLKRGFLAPIVKFEEVESNRGGHRFEFETESFQTTPVIFKSIIVGNFSSSISSLKNLNTNPEGKELMGHEFWIQVHASYSHFGGGSNGCNLFSVKGKFFSVDDESETNWDNRVLKIQIC